MADKTPFDFLIGGKITAIKQAPDEDGWNPRDLMTTITVTFPKPKTLSGYPFETPCLAKSVDLEVWQDEEGNGAGALVIASAMEVVRA